MPNTSDAAGNGQLNLTRADVALLAHALNNTRLNQYSPSQRERLPTLCRKLAGYLAETEPYKYVRKTEPKPKLLKPQKTQLGFSIGCPFVAAAASSPIE